MLRLSHMLSRWPSMRRRHFIGVVGSIVATWVLEARAQQPERVRRIGVLMSFGDPTTQSWLAAFRDALTKLGWSEGSNLPFNLIINLKAAKSLSLDVP